MKVVKVIFFLALIAQVLGVNYYFDSENGDDSNSVTQAQNPATPWQTLDRLMLARGNIQPGDQILFKRGGRFFGGMTWYNSASQNAPFVLADYGDPKAPPPIITGAVTLINWRSEGNNVWSSLVNYTLDNAIGRGNPFQVFVDNQRMTAARTPNVGWYRMTGGGGSNFQDSTRTEGSGYFNGCTVRARGSTFQWGVATVTNYNSGNFQLDSSLNGGAGKGFGYYVEGRMDFLDSPGEWFWEKSSNRVYLRTLTDDNPNNHFVDVTVLIQGMEFVGSASWYTFRNIQFEKNTNFNIRMDNSGASGIVADNCRFLFANVHYMSNGGSNNVAQNSYFYESYQNAIVLGPGNAINNTVLNNGMLPGYGGGSYAISSNYHTSGSIVQGNRVENCGYVGISYAGTNDKVIGNFINNTMQLLSDGGGIYAWGGVPTTDAIIQDNIVMNAYGGNESLPIGWSATGICIYCDDNLLRITVQGNTMAHCTYGLFVHNDQNVKAINNVIFDAEELIHMQNNGYSFANNIFQDNILVTANFGQMLIKEPYNPSGPNPITYSGNYVCDPYDEGLIEGQWNNLYSISQYIDMYPSGFSRCNFRLPYYHVKEYLGENIVPNGNFSENTTAPWNSYPGGSFQYIGAGNEGCSSNCLKYNWSPDHENSGGAYINVPIPSLTRGSSYELTFKSHVTYAHVVGAFVRNTGPPYQVITQWYNDGYETTEVDYGYIFWVNQQTSIPVSLEWGGNRGTVPNAIYLSDISLRPVTYYNETSNQIFVNPSNQPATIQLPGGTWTDIKGNSVTGSIQLPAMGSEVLFGPSSSSKKIFIL